MNEAAFMMSDLLTQLKAKRVALGTKTLAEALGVTDSAVRMVCTGHYPTPGRVLAKFAKVYIDVVACPYAGRDIGRPDCLNRSSGPKPFGGPSKLAWWDACQRCPNKMPAGHKG